MNTQPLHGSHLSAVNGFLELGAFTVIGTSLPIDGKEAAEFIGYLVAGLIDLQNNEWKGSIRWSQFIGTLLQQQYLIEVLRRLPCEDWLISDADQKLILERSIDSINSGDDWVKVFTEDIAKFAGLNAHEVKKKINEKAYFTHAAAYAQFGIPENIFITN